MLKLFAEVQTALKRYPTHDEDRYSTTFAWPEAGPTIAIFQVVYFDFLGHGRIFIGINVMPDAPAVAHDALRMNSEIVIGALTAFHGTLLLKHLMTLGGFDADELHAVLLTMARTAERTRERLTRVTPYLNAGYAD